MSIQDIIESTDEPGCFTQLADLARGYEQMKAERDEILAEIAATPWQGTPVEANVYHDDISWCIHLWHDGVSHDIRIPLAAHKAVTEGVQP